MAAADDRLGDSAVCHRVSVEVKFNTPAGGNLKPHSLGCLSRRCSWPMPQTTGRAVVTDDTNVVPGDGTNARRLPPPTCKELGEWQTRRRHRHRLPVRPCPRRSVTPGRGWSSSSRVVPRKRCRTAGHGHLQRVVMLVVVVVEVVLLVRR